MTSPRLTRLAESTRTEAEAMAERCPVCKGTGAEAAMVAMIEPSPRPWRFTKRAVYVCPACHGTGKKEQEQ